MTVGELIRLMKSKGCEIIRHGANHDIWRNPETGEEVAIPRHQSKELTTGTANRIIKVLGLK